MRAQDALIAWTPPASWLSGGVPTGRGEKTVGMVSVGSLYDRNSLTYGWADDFTHTGGAAFVERRQMDDRTATRMVFIDFHTLVVGYGFDPKVVHEAFLAIDQFRRYMSPDIPGADLPDGFSPLDGLCSKSPEV